MYKYAVNYAYFDKIACGIVYFNFCYKDIRVIENVM